MFKMPAFHPLLASGILATGMESAKVLRLLNKVWQMEQSARQREIEDEPIIIESDMCVDSPGHSGLFGSGSTLEMK